MKNTGIQWAIDTANPTSGCAGCELARPSMSEDERVCYAYHVHMNRLRHSLPEKYAQSFFEVRLIAGRMAQYANGRDLKGVEKKDHPWIPVVYPRVIFISDMADALSPAVPFEYLRDEIINVVGGKVGKRHVWMWLTKQAKRLVEFRDWLTESGVPWPSNLWPGVSVTAKNTLWRVDHLMSRQYALAHTFVSYEPAWEWVDFFTDRDNLPSMIIAGGESGAIKRPFDVDWARRLIAQGQKAHATSIFIKQLGAVAVVTTEKDGERSIDRMTLKDSHGGNWMEWPSDLRVRQFPRIWHLDIPR